MNGSLAATRPGRYSRATGVALIGWLLLVGGGPQSHLAVAADEPPVAAADASQSSPSVRTLDGGMTVELTADRRVTLLGEATSRAAVVSTICEMAGIELREYAASSDSYLAKIENVSIEEAFRRILRSESYLLGLSPGDGGGPRRVTWIRVLGDQPDLARARDSFSASATADESTDAGEPLAEAKPKPPFTLPAHVLAPAFSTPNDEARGRAQQALIARLSDAAAAEAFASADTGQLAEQIRRYVNPLQGLEELRGKALNSAVRAKLADISKAIRELDSSKPVVAP